MCCLEATFYKQCVVQVEKHFCKCSHLCCKLTQHVAQSAVHKCSTLSNILLQLTTKGAIQETILQLAIQGIQILLVLLGLKGWCMRKVKNSLLKQSISSFKQYCYKIIWRLGLRDMHWSAIKTSVLYFS